MPLVRHGPIKVVISPPYVGGASSPGGRTRTRVLVALRLLTESYPSELARLLESSLFNVQKAILGLEKDGLVATRAMGRTRVVRLDPRYFAREELQRYLMRLSEPEDKLRRRVESIRRRPRRSGKPL